MKNGSFICCLLLCSLFTLIACTKNNDNATPVTPPPGGDTTSTNPDSSGNEQYGPGDTLIVRGDTTNNDETALLYAGDGGVSQPDFPVFAALGKGFSQTSDRTRSIMKFRLRHITDSTRANPPHVQKAVLYLYQYNDPAKQDLYSVQQDANNGLELYRVIGDWQDSTITWHTQPTLASGSTNPLEDKVTVPSVTTPLASGTNDDQAIDITDMMNKILSSESNKGFLLKLADESGKSGRSFGSFTCPDVNKRPKLVLFF